MDWVELAEIGAIALIVSLAGGGLISKIITDRHASKLKHDLQKQLEDYRTKLIKSEFLYSKEFDAATEFISLRRSFMPECRHPDMIWDEYCEEVASNFTGMKCELEQYIANHGAALEQEVLSRLSRVVAEIDAGKFEATSRSVSEQGIEVASKAIEELEEIEKTLIDSVRSQSTT